MDIQRELSRLLPGFDQVPTDAQARDYLRFLAGLNRKEYEEVLRFLPIRLSRHREAAVKDEAAWEKFTDFLCFQSILNYTRFVMAREIVRLLSNKKGIGSDLYRLALMMSEGARKRIENELLAAEVKVCLAYLETYFKGDRPGMVDLAVEEMLKAFDKERSKKAWEAWAGDRWWDDIELSRSKLHDERILKAIQEKRRKDPNRLPAKIKTSYDVRFIVEEINRELFVYPQPNEARASDLIEWTMIWFENSECLRSIRRNPPIYMIEAGFFYYLDHVRSRIALGASYEGHWNSYIRFILRSEKFWHDISGLNRDIPIEQSEAGRRTETYRQAALVGGLLFAGIALLPLTVKLAVAAPGAAIRLVTWTGGRLLLATQYASSTYRAFGVIGGTSQMAREGYTYYLQNAVTLNERIVNVTEFVLDITTEGTGLAPGATPADVYAYMAKKTAILTGKKGVSQLASEARAAVRQADTEVELAKFVVKDADGKLYEVVGKVTGHQDGKIKLARVGHTEVMGGAADQARKEITFFSKPKQEANLIQDPRATMNNGVLSSVPTTDSKALNTATNTAKAEVASAAARRAQKIEQKRQEAQKLAENLAQQQALKQIGERKVVNAPDTGVIEMARKEGGQGGGDSAVLGRATPARGSGKVDARTRSTADPGNLTADGKGLKDRANGSHLKSVPADPPVTPPGVRLSSAGYRIVDDEAVLDPLKQVGFKLERTGVKSPKSGGGRFQKHGTGDAEWHVRSPSGVEADIDGLAVDPHKPGGLIAVEAKATFVEDAAKSAHLAFYPEKVEQITRQLVISLESKGLMRMEILCNADSVAETYLNMVAQQMALDLKKRFMQQAKAFLASSTDKAVRKLSLVDLERIVEENVTVVVSHWGRLKARK